jgi:drug/metabolite transporter (DMT)-like permease
MPKKRVPVLSRNLCYALLLVSAVCWALSLPIVKPALIYTTPFRYLFYRYALAVVFSLPLFFYYLPQLRKLAKYIPIIIGIELFGTTLGLSLLYFGLHHTSAMEASLIGTTAPVFITVAGVLFLKEKQERHEWLGLAVALLGTLILIVLPNLGKGSVFALLPSFGNMLILLQNVGTGIYFVLAKKYFQGIPKFFVTTVGFYLGLISFFFLSLMESHFSWTSFTHSVQIDLTSPSVLLAAFYMAIFGSIIGLTAYMKGLEGIEISEAGLFGYLQPLIYFPFIIFFLNEPISLSEILALGCILLGVVVAEKRFRRIKPKKRFS